MNPSSGLTDDVGRPLPTTLPPNVFAVGCRLTFSSEASYLTISPGLATPLFPPYPTDLNTFLYAAALSQLWGVAPPLLEYGWTIAPGKTVILRSAFQLVGLRLSF